MYSLVIDTSTSVQYISIFKDKNELFCIQEKVSNSHSENININLEKVLKTNNLNFSDLNEVIVVNGPGSFTGVRIGLMCAKLIAYEYNIELYSISTLVLLAMNNLDKNKISISASKVKSYAIDYVNIDNKISNYNIYSTTDKKFDIIDIDLNYKNIFSNKNLLKKENIFSSEPNYVETPNYVKKLNK